MSSIEELIDKFKQYDEAVKERNYPKILEYYAHLLGEKKSNIKLIGEGR